MKIREFISTECDVDVCCDITDDWAIAAVCPIHLTSEGADEWYDVLELEIEVSHENEFAVVQLDELLNSDWAELRVRKFFEAAAGYCSIAESELWFG